MSQNKKNSKEKKRKPSKSLISKKASLSPEVVPSSQERKTALQSYLSHISRFPLLSKEEEYKLAVQYYETKDPEMAKRLIQANLRFVIKIASEYSRFNSKLMDLIQEGNVGLLKAVQEFNPYKGAKLITYAVWWIRGYIQEYLIRQHSIVRIGTNKKQQKLFYLLQKEKQALDRFDRKNILPAIASSTDLTRKEVERMEQVVLKKDLSLDQPLTSDSSVSFLDIQEDSSLPMDESLSLQEQSFLLRKHLKELEKDFNEKEKVIIKDRLLKDPPKTLQSIADHFGVTREAVRQAEERLLKKLKEKLIPILKKPY